MWLLYITVAMAPNFTPHTQEIRYLTEPDCKRALERYMAAVSNEGVVIIGRCTRVEKK